MPVTRIGDSRAILTGIARILVNCGHAPEQLTDEFREICTGLPPSNRRWNPEDLEYAAKLPDVLADWNDEPQYVDQGKPRLLPMHGPTPSMASLVGGVFPERPARPIVQSLMRMGAVRRRGNRFECVSRNLIIKDGIEAYWRALTTVHGILRTLEGNLAGESSLLEQTAINVRVPARDVPVIQRLAREGGLPVLLGLDAEMRRRARHAAPDEPREWAGVGMYVIHNPFELQPTLKTSELPARKRALAKIQRPRRRHR